MTRAAAERRSGTLFPFTGASLIVSLGEAMLLSRAWSDCDVGLNATTNLLTVVFLVIPGLWLANVLALVVAALALRASSRGDVGRSAPYVVGAVALGAVALAMWVFVATPGWYPDPICPENVPAWWPSWLPS